MSSSFWRKLKQMFQPDEAPPEPPSVVIPEVIMQKKAAGHTAVSQSPASFIDPIFLRQQMSNHLNEAQLTTVGAEIGVDYSTLPGGKGRKVLELVTAFEKQGKLADLLRLCQAQNSDIQWQLEKNDE